MSDRSRTSIAFAFLGATLAASLVTWVVEPIADEFVRRVLIAGAAFLGAAGGGALLFVEGDSDD